MILSNKSFTNNASEWNKKKLSTKDQLQVWGMYLIIHEYSTYVNYNSPAKKNCNQHLIWDIIIVTAYC